MSVDREKGTQRGPSRQGWNLKRSTYHICLAHDLAGYAAIVREPANITYRNSRIFSTVAPSSGAVVLSAMKIFEGYQGNYTDSDPEINVTTHRLVEAAQFAYGQRTQCESLSFSVTPLLHHSSLMFSSFTANVSELERYYLTDAAAADVLNKIRDNAPFPVAYYDPANYTEGMTISLTTTVNSYRGSQGMMTDGVILNNEMDDFSASGQRNAFGFAPSPINFIRPGKRLQSSIASSIAEDLETGEVTIVTGSAGGSRIITATMQELHHFIDQGIGAAECTRHPRWHDQLGGLAYFEIKNDALGIAGFDNATVTYMKALGYNTTYEDLSGSTSHAVLKTLTVDPVILISAYIRAPSKNDGL
ncbi:gamma-glutamyltranspeptidase [Mycena vulgaris]|nr:gamma-glutamyltranspeptidase [Mycena vulgaris]